MTTIKTTKSQPERCLVLWKIEILAGLQASVTIRSGNFTRGGGDQLTVCAWTMLLDLATVFNTKHRLCFKSPGRTWPDSRKDKSWRTIIIRYLVASWACPDCHRFPVRQLGGLLSLPKMYLWIIFWFNMNFHLVQAHLCGLFLKQRQTLIVGAALYDEGQHTGDRRGRSVLV
jgi:hypothetical protein